MQTLRKKIAYFAQTYDLHNMRNMRTTCEEVLDNECSLYFNKFKIGVQVLFHRSPCHSLQLPPSQLNLASDKNP